MKKSLDWEVDKFQALCGLRSTTGCWAPSSTPKNYILPLLRPHFCGRFPEENFMIYDAVHQAVLLQEDHKARLLELAAPLELPPAQRAGAAVSGNCGSSSTRRWRSRPATTEKCRMTHCPKRFWADMVEMKDEF